MMLVLLSVLLVLASAQGQVIANILRGNDAPRTAPVDPNRLAKLRAAIDDTGLPPHPLKAKYGAIGGYQGKDERGGRRAPFVPVEPYTDLIGAYQTFYDR